MNKTTRSAFCILHYAFCIVLAALQAGATGTWYTSSWSGGFTPSASNILYGKGPDNPSPATADALVRADNHNLINEGSKSYATLTDGMAGTKDKSGTTCLPSNFSLTYAIGSGKTVNEVRIYSTWSDTGRDTLSVASVQAETSDGQTVVLSPASVSFSDNNNCACAALKMDDDSPLCTNACKITFNFGAQENGYVGYSELEVLVDGFSIAMSGVIEITVGNDVSATETPADYSIYGPNGGNLTISGAGVVVTQNVPTVKTMDGVNFGNYWPWLDGIVTVENGARLESNTQLFWGSGQGETYRYKTRKLVVQSGASAAFSPASGEAYLVGPQNCSYENAWVVVTGTNSTLTLPANVYLSNRSDNAGHGGGMDILDGGHVELGTLNAGYSSGTLFLNVNGGSLKTTGGFYVYRTNARWTGGTISLKNCVIETPFYKCAYQSSQFTGDIITFDGAVFRPIGTPAAKFIDGSPIAGNLRILHTVTGNGLIVEAPSGASLEVSAMLQGAGGFTKRGAGTVTLSGANTYTGTTAVEAGTLNITGALVGGLSVASNATCAVTLAAAPSAGAVSVAGTTTFNTALTATSLSLPTGGTLTVTGVGSDVGTVSDYAGDFVVAGVSEWPKNTAIVSSPTAGFLEKVAAALNASETVEAGFEFAVVNETSVQLVAAGIVNQTMTWDGMGSDTLWSTVGNWSNATRRIYSGDALVVAAGGDSTADLGEEVVLPTVRFNEGIAAHTVSPAGASDSLKINTLVTNESFNTQTFNLPVSIGEADFAVHAAGDVVFSNGLATAAGITPAVTKTGAGTLAIDGATWGGPLDLQEGAVALSGQTAGAAVLSATAGDILVNGVLDAGGAAVTLADTSPRILGENAVLANGLFTYVPRTGYNYLDLGENQVLTLTNNATFTTTAPIFENGVGNNRGVKVLDGSTLVFDNNGNGFISSKDNGTGNFLYASGGSTIILPRGRTYIAWPSWAGRNGRMDVADGSFIAGGSVEFGWRATASWFTLTDSVASFTDGLYLDVNGNIDYAHSHMHVFGSVVTSAVWRVGNSAGKVHGSTELVFDDATIVPSKADTAAAPYFYCTKPNCNQISILAGGLAIDSAYDVTVNAPFVGVGGLTKLGEGAVSLLSTNTYAGATIVSNGTLRLIGRVAGAVQVAPGATLALPTDGGEIPTVASLVVEDGATLASLTQTLPEGRTRVDVLQTTGELTIPPQSPDAAKYQFTVRQYPDRKILRYGKSVGLQILLH